MNKILNSTNSYDELVNAIPAYKRIYYEIKDDILACRLEPNSKLPSENELRKKYDVSRYTIQHALQLLENAGLIIRRQGRATLIRALNNQNEVQVLSLGCLNPFNVLLTQYCQIFADRVLELTNGFVKIEVHHSSILGNGKEQLHNVQQGSQDIFCAAVEWLSELDSVWNIANYPFIFKNIEHLKKFAMHPQTELLRNSLVDGHGIRMIGYNWYRPSRLLLSKKPCLHEEDIVGMKIGIPSINLYHQIWSTLGAIPIEVNFGERKQALKDGRIDATDLNWDIMLSETLYEDACYATLTQHLFSRACLLMNEKKFQSFRPDLQSAIMQAAFDTGNLYSQKLFNSFELDKENLLAHGMCFIESTFPNWRKKIDNLAKKDLQPNSLGMKLYERITQATSSDL